MKKMYAIYSKKQELVCGSSEYERADGTRVTVTCVEDIHGCPSVKWDDKQDMGEVVKYVRQVTKGDSRASEFGFNERIYQYE